MSAARTSAAADAGLPAQVFAALADGEFHSGESLAARFGVTRSAVWKAIEQLRAIGAELQAVPNRGYRLERPTKPLDARSIAAAFDADCGRLVRRLEVRWSLPSTNAELLAQPEAPPGVADVLLAEHQSAGRGRRGRAWLGPLGGALYLSISRTFAQPPPDLGALGLAVGVCARRALHDVGARGVMLKWPNDLVAADAKLGGILIELRAESDGPTFAVIGIGLNVSLSEALRAQIAASGTSATDLRTLGLPDADRNVLAAGLVARCLQGLREFEAEGLRPFAAEWLEADVLRGRTIDVRAPSEAFAGIARGIDTSGALLVETLGGLRKLIGGEVTVRAGS